MPFARRGKAGRSRMNPYLVSIYGGE